MPSDMKEIEMFASFGWPVAVACKRNERELQLLRSGGTLYCYRGQIDDGVRIFARIVHPMILDDVRLPLSDHDSAIQMKPVFNFLADAIARYAQLFESRYQARQIPPYLDFKQLFDTLAQNDVSVSAQTWFKALQMAFTNLPVLATQLPVGRELFTSRIVH